MRVTITTPEETTSVFVVAADEDPGAPEAVARQRLPDHLAAEVTSRLGTPLLVATCHPAAASPWDLSEVEGAGEDLERLGRAGHHIGVTSVLPASELPSGPHLARIAAQAIAEGIGGVLADPSTGQVLPRPFGRFEEFVLADGWLGVSRPPRRNPGGCPAAEDEIDGCSCVDLRTRGLRRFGLPDLEITNVACPHGLAALNVLRTAAQRLLSLGRHPGEHILPPELMLTSADFAAFWGCQDPVWDDGPIPVSLGRTRPGRLGIRPPVNFPGTLNEWLWDELPPILHELISCEPDHTVLSGPG